MSAQRTLVVRLLPAALVVVATAVVLAPTRPTQAAPLTGNAVSVTPGSTTSPLAISLTPSPGPRRPHPVRPAHRSPAPRPATVKTVKPAPPAVRADATLCGAPVRQVLRTNPRPVAPKTVALTFDDGPSPTTTPLILAVLRRNHVHATFFVVGQEAAAYPQLLRRIAAGGNKIGNHSYTHPLPHDGGRFDLLPPALMSHEVDATSALIAKVTGRAPCFFRAPGGADSSKELHDLVWARGMTIVNWTYDPRDWAAPTALSADYQRHIVQFATGTRPHVIVLNHDGPAHSFRGNTVASLQATIDYYRSRGYVFTDPSGRTF